LPLVKESQFATEKDGHTTKKNIKKNPIKQKTYTMNQS
jgi:hypothetical protein